jgi:hypothetical protein
VRDAAERAVTRKLCGRMKLTVTVDSGCTRGQGYLFVVEALVRETAASLEYIASGKLSSTQLRHYAATAAARVRQT